MELEDVDSCPVFTTYQLCDLGQAREVYLSESP